MKTTILIAGIVTGLGLSAVSAQAERGGERPDFATLDLDGNGEISMEELEAQGEARFAAADTDGNGALSEAELAAQASDRALGRINKMIERLDTNEDGELQQDELQAAHEGRRGGGDRFARMDTDESGGVSEDEFNAAKERRGGHRRHGEKGPRDGATDEG